MEDGLEEMNFGSGVAKAERPKNAGKRCFDWASAAIYVGPNRGSFDDQRQATCERDQKMIKARDNLCQLCPSIPPVASSRQLHL